MQQTDIFSLGIVLWELVTGELLYKDDDDVTLLSQVRKADITPPRQVRPDIPQRERHHYESASTDVVSGISQPSKCRKISSVFLRKHQGSYGPAQLGYYMRSMFYDELPKQWKLPIFNPLETERILCQRSSLSLACPRSRIRAGDGTTTKISQMSGVMWSRWSMSKDNRRSPFRSAWVQVLNS